MQNLLYQLLEIVTAHILKKYRGNREAIEDDLVKEIFTNNNLTYSKIEHIRAKKKVWEEPLLFPNVTPHGEKHPDSRIGGAYKTFESFKVTEDSAIQIDVAVDYRSIEDVDRDMLELQAKLYWKNLPRRGPTLQQLMRGGLL